MPKKMGVNSKAEAARARRSATDSDRKEREAKEKEDQYWREAEGAKPKAAKKREEEAEKRAEANARKAEARRLAELEEKELEKSLKKPDKKANRVSVPVPKVTEAELRRRKEEEQAAMQLRSEEEKRKQSRLAAEEEYERMVSVENTNRDDSIIEARTVDEALARMTLVDNLPVDKHPEKRLKASFKAFEEAELSKLKEEKPGLTHNQYKDMIWKLWKKSPDNPLNQTDSESLSRSNELDQMREKLEYHKLVMGKMPMHSKVVKEKVRKQEEQLGGEIRSLLVGGSSLSAANRRMQDSSRSFAGDKGYGHLKISQKSLRMRQQYMVSQVYLLYPVKVVVRKASEQELESLCTSIKSGVHDGSKLVDQCTLTISGLHLTVIPFTKMSFFTDKKEVQRSSTALGYVAHAVSLIASYLQVPLRYPLRLGGSRSYVRDYSPSVEHSGSSTSLDSAISTSTKPVEFPLFVEGQDSTRAAYVVFLLNKDLEQLLNFIGVNSLGPRRVLSNLKELTRTILSPDYIDM